MSNLDNLDFLTALEKVKSFLTATKTENSIIMLSDVFDHKRIAEKFKLGKDLNMATKNWEDLEDQVLKNTIIRKGMDHALSLKAKFIKKHDHSDILRPININHEDIIEFAELESIIQFQGLQLNMPDLNPPKCCLNQQQFNLIKELITNIKTSNPLI